MIQWYDWLDACINNILTTITLIQNVETPTYSNAFYILTSIINVNAISMHSAGGSTSISVLWLATLAANSAISFLDSSNSMAVLVADLDKIWLHNFLRTSRFFDFLKKWKENIGDWWGLYQVTPIDFLPSVWFSISLIDSSQSPLQSWIFRSGLPKNLFWFLTSTGWDSRFLSELLTALKSSSSLPRSTSVYGHWQMFCSRLSFQSSNCNSFE